MPRYPAKPPRNVRRWLSKSFSVSWKGPWFLLANLDLYGTDVVRVSKRARQRYDEQEDKLELSGHGRMLALANPGYETSDNVLTSAVGWTIPSFFIRERNVLGFRPRISAAPPAPRTRQPQRSHTERM